jgi:FKBP-type peptidyl-prolyl cis-trans isomerase (trigger factor)
VAQEEKMKVSAEELENELKSLGRQTEEKFEDIKKNLGEGGAKYIEDYLLRRKALDFLLEKAKIKMVEWQEPKEEKT